MTLLGAVLAGGQARRFGSDKAMAELDGHTLLAHAVATLGDCTDRIVIVGRDDPALPSTPDWPGRDLGPLGGICGALRYARSEGYDAVLSVPCDMPSLPADLVAKLAGMPGDAYVASAPVIGRWSVGAFEALADRLVGEPDRSVIAWARSIGAQEVTWHEPLTNINRPEDLDRAIRNRPNQDDPS